MVMPLLRCYALVAFLLVLACGKRSSGPATTPQVVTGSVTGQVAIATNRMTKEQTEAFTRALAYPLSREQVASILRSVIRAEIPTNATDDFGYSRRLFTQVIDVRFTCSRADLHAFLASSSNLRSELQSSELGLLQRNTDFDWWRPPLLKNTKGSTQHWRQGADTVYCDLLAGESDDSETFTVYLGIVLEATQ